ncbi:MAG: ATP-binding cassette domain-containing protein [Magnetococcales bacterium]|nr:ATP-binding cassette domain-containing protein [Magnetococcales bacterium]
MSDLDFSIRYTRSDRFSLQAHLCLPGEGTTAIVGGSGGGKTTLLRILAGLESHVEGTIALGGHEWLNSAKKINLPPQKRHVGVVFQDYALFPHMTVSQNIAFGINEKNRLNMPDYLRRFDLSGLADEYPSALSGGQRQRVALARALATHPELLLLDEPFSAVDVPLRSKLRDELWRIIRHQGIPALLITHDLSDVRLLADWVVVVDEGRIIRSGPTNLVLSRPRSQRAARILGWDNLLPLTGISGNTVQGDWGTLRLNQPVPEGAVSLGILPDRISIVSQPGSNNLPVTLERISRAAGGLELNCRLLDGTRLRVLQSMDEPIPAPGPLMVYLPEKNLHCLGDATPLQDADSTAREQVSFTTPANEEAA